MKVYRKSPHFLSEWGLWISPVEENFKSNLVCKWFEFASPRPLYFVNHYKQLHFFFIAQFFKPCSTENILVDFRRQFDYIDFTCIATSCFQNVYDNALTTTHTHTKQWYCRLVYIKYYTTNLKIIWQYFNVTGNNSIGWNIFSARWLWLGFTFYGISVLLSSKISILDAGFYFENEIINISPIGSRK